MKDRLVVPVLDEPEHRRPAREQGSDHRRGSIVEGGGKLRPELEERPRPLDASPNELARLLEEGVVDRPSLLGARGTGSRSRRSRSSPGGCRSDRVPEGPASGPASDSSAGGRCRSHPIAARSRRRRAARAVEARDDRPDRRCGCSSRSTGPRSRTGSRADPARRRRPGRGRVVGRVGTARSSAGGRRTPSARDHPPRPVRSPPATIRAVEPPLPGRPSRRRGRPRSDRTHRRRRSPAGRRSAPGGSAPRSSRDARASGGRTLPRRLETERRTRPIGIGSEFGEILEDSVSRHHGWPGRRWRVYPRLSPRRRIRGRSRPADTIPHRRRSTGSICQRRLVCPPIGASPHEGDPRQPPRPLCRRQHGDRRRRPAAGHLHRREDLRLPRDRPQPTRGLAVRRPRRHLRRVDRRGPGRGHRRLQPTG